MSLCWRAGILSTGIWTGWIHGQWHESQQGQGLGPALGSQQPQAELQPVRRVLEKCPGTAATELHLQSPVCVLKSIKLSQKCVLFCEYVAECVHHYVSKESKLTGKVVGFGKLK